jgi:hypothetical protein
VEAGYPLEVSKALSVLTGKNYLTTPCFLVMGVFFLVASAFAKDNIGLGVGFNILGLET